MTQSYYNNCNSFLFLRKHIRFGKAFRFRTKRSGSWRLLLDRLRHRLGHRLWSFIGKWLWHWGLFRDIRFDRFVLRVILTVIIALFLNRGLLGAWSHRCISLDRSFFVIDVSNLEFSRGTRVRIRILRKLFQRRFTALVWNRLAGCLKPILSLVIRLFNFCIELVSSSKVKHAGLRLLNYGPWLRAPGLWNLANRDV